MAIADMSCFRPSTASDRSKSPRRTFWCNTLVISDRKIGGDNNRTPAVLFCSLEDGGHTLASANAHRDQTYLVVSL